MAKRGRPRLFDRDEAVARAMHVFWRLGYENATLPDLQEAMGGITPASFYAAFGSKEALFRETVALYRASPAGTTTARALAEQPTARASIEAMLRGAAEGFVSPERPPGCLIVLGAMHCSPASRAIQDDLTAIRRQAREDLRQRLQRGVMEGDVPAGTDLDALASFYTTLLHGLSIQARDGASREALLAAVDCGMAAWDRLVGRNRRESRKSPAAMEDLFGRTPE